MRILSFWACILLTTTAFANEITCKLEEDFQGQTTVSQLTLPESSDPHDAMAPFQLVNFPEYSGFVALSNGFTVINLVNEKTDVGTSVQSKGQDNFVRLQLVVGSDNESINEIVIQCGEPK